MIPALHIARSISAFFYRSKIGIEAWIEELNLPKIQIPTRPGMKMTLSKIVPSSWTQKATTTIPETHPGPAVSTASLYSLFLQVSASLHALTLRHCFLYVATSHGGSLLYLALSK